MLLQDIKYALRGLIKSPGFTVIAVVCLALGIGVNTTIFSTVDGVMLKPYPYPDADRIVIPHSTNQKAGITRAGVSYKDYEDWRDHNKTLSSIAVFQAQRSLTIADGRSDPERYSGALCPGRCSGCSAHRPRSDATSVRTTTGQAPSRWSS